MKRPIRRDEVQGAVDRYSFIFKAGAVKVAQENGSTTDEELEAVLPQSLRDMALLIAASETLLDMIDAAEALDD